MTSNPADVLLPCPFCGNHCAALNIDQGTKWAHWEPTCLEVRTGYNLDADAPWRAQVAHLWNTRIPKTPKEQINDK